ncbi:MAG: flavodoxin family protein [Promethearchaeota archaeon]|jgi:flavodoxin
MKVLIVYETKYGNTKKAAEVIGESIKEAGNEITVMKVNAVNMDNIKDYGAVVIGSPTYASSQARSIKKFIKGLDVEEELKIVVFDTHTGDGKSTGGMMRRAVKKMEKQIENNPKLNKVIDGLQVAVKGIKGPLIDGELDKCKEFGKKIASKL